MVTIKLPISATTNVTVSESLLFYVTGLSKEPPKYECYLRNILS